MSTITHPAPSPPSIRLWMKQKKSRISRRGTYPYIKQENRSTTVYANAAQLGNQHRPFICWMKQNYGGRRERGEMVATAKDNDESPGCGGRSLSCALVLPHRRNATKPARRRRGTCRAGCLHPRAVWLAFQPGRAVGFGHFCMARHGCLDRLGTVIPSQPGAAATTCRQRLPGQSVQGEMFFFLFLSSRANTAPVPIALSKRQRLT
jgi:hypothetical protein